MNKKILILIGDIGSGHRSAATAITDQFKKSKPSYKVKVIDLFTYKPKGNPDRSITELISKKIVDNQANDDAYEFMSKTQFMSFIYDSTWHMSNTKVGSTLTRNVMISAYKHEVNEILDDYKPGIVISIHPLMNMIIDSVIDQYSFKFFNIITDLVSLHSGWIDKEADLTFSPSKEATQTLIANGLDKDKIIDPLFPVKPQFQEIKSRNKVLKELGLETDKTTILMAGGGSGIYSALKHIKRLLRSNKYQIIIITGKTKTLETDLKRKYKNKDNVKILGYINNMQDIMGASDIVISKTGPGTIIELEVLNKKAVFTKYVGAQEKGNVYYISSNPLFRYIGDRTDLVDEKIEELRNLTIKQKPKRSVLETERIVDTIIKNS